MDRDIRATLLVIWKRRWYALIALVAAIGVAAALTFSAVPVYEAGVSLFVGQPQFTVQDLGPGGSGLALNSLSTALLKSYAQILSSRSIAERAVLDSSLDVTPAEIQGGLSVSPVPDTQVIVMSFKSSDSARAQRVANAVAQAFVRQIKQLDVPQNGAASAAVTVSIIDPALRPTTPISPRPKRNLAFAGVLGMLLGAGVALGIEYIDTSVKNREDTERLGFPVVGVIPRLETKGAEVFLDRDPQNIGSEAFRKLRASIGFLGVDEPIKTLLITSPIAREGKTTVALNLANAYAQAGHRTLLVEADLRRPSLHRVFGQTGTDGLTTVIIGDTSVAAAVRHGDVPNLDCLVAGAVPPNPVELLDSAQMENLLQMLRSHYDMVIVDSPPIIPVADSITLGVRCDGVLVVARAGKTPKDRLVRAVAQVEQSGARFLGVALNQVRAADSPYEYEDYYSYRSANRESAVPRREG